ncbi:antibiotic biosynthesis monooxygenase family protein [Thiocystis violacea]|uniref:antibiotic biosynthesis monooxygenase family protein n=1 Tax=Thiocystis violacea TaxID=13725 RepID=UPI0019049EAA|nr:antibiotic biosynthesis monooxygenase [Thiocystis violacea]MBK1723881.1 antibiotic biosynthesis monooxygenase [Thiocystis violacea]
MYLAMNRFRIARGQEDAFVEHWRNRESYLDEVPGFLRFHLLKGPQAEDHTLFSSFSEWTSEDAFVAWTHSEAFRAAHANAGNTTRDLYLGPPQLELFESVI